MTNTPQERREEIARRQWHDLKCIPPFFDDVASGAKPFEVRKNDRDYQEGDGLRLREWTATDGYSGRVVERFVTYVLRDAYAFGVQPGYVVLGLALPAVPTSDEGVEPFEPEIQQAREWLTRLLDGVVNANSAAETAAVKAYRSCNR